MADEKKHSRVASTMGGSDKPKKSAKKKKSGGGKKKKVHKIHVSKLASGGYLAEHEAPMPGPDETGPQPPPDQHALPDEAALADHFAQHLPSGPDDEQAEGEAPPAPAGPPPGAAPAPQGAV